ncbi:TetR family transcriptional regulator [Actinophytocola oryzae]|uniref:TetR family transcriptional regulator n=1 Tax=Actinophytocola oryzae TaxID=502181 RepID=A0A4R7UWB2_9PSEU|nr:TetR family transcriptional regulator [Actinophytocola oryzae]
MQAVLAESGVSLGSLYHHFTNFDGLAASSYAKCMAELLDHLVAELARTRTARRGVEAVVRAYLSFVVDQSSKARFIHASAYATYLPAYKELIAETKKVRMARMAEWLAPHVAAGTVIPLPDPLTEMLLIGPVAELSRRWLTDPTIDLEKAAGLLPARIWAALAA